MKWLERGRKWWKASAARIIDCTELLVLDKEDKVRAAARIAGVEKDLDEGSGRISIIPSKLPAKHEELIEKKIRRPESRNPVVYRLFAFKGVGGVGIRRSGGGSVGGSFGG